MPTATRTEKIRFAKEQFKKGAVTTSAEIQEALKSKFGSGVPFADMAKVFPKKRTGKKKKAGRKRRAAGRTGGRGAARGRRPRRRGRPPGSRRNQLLLVARDDVEFFSSARKLHHRVAELVAGGVAEGDMSVYKKTQMRVKVTTSVTV